MKKYFLSVLIAICCVAGAYAEVGKFQATSAAYKLYNYNSRRWSGWSDWTPTNILVVVNYDIDRVTIYSKNIQEYDVYATDSTGARDSNGETETFSCVDQDGKRCDIRIRRQYDGAVQIYVDYSDASLVYNVEPR